MEEHCISRESRGSRTDLEEVANLPFDSTVRTGTDTVLATRATRATYPLYFVSPPSPSSSETLGIALETLPWTRFPWWAGHPLEANPQLGAKTASEPRIHPT